MDIGRRRSLASWISAWPRPLVLATQIQHTNPSLQS